MHNFLICLLILLPHCSSEKKNDNSIQIVIQCAKSYKYDLRNRVYTVFFLSRPPFDIKFDLTTPENNSIIKMYYDLNLYELKNINQITKNIYIKDGCATMPKLFTILQVKSAEQNQEIQIDQDCNDFYFSNFQTARKVKFFIKFIEDIIQSKPEIKNAPKSDIWYI